MEAPSTLPANQMHASREKDIVKNDEFKEGCHVIIPLVPRPPITPRESP
jgi:hypothetical protein